MREICTSGSTRGEGLIPASSPTLPAFFGISRAAAKPNQKTQAEMPRRYTKIFVDNTKSFVVFCAHEP